MSFRPRNLIKSDPSYVEINAHDRLLFHTHHRFRMAPQGGDPHTWASQGLAAASFAEAQMSHSETATATSTTTTTDPTDAAQSSLSSSYSSSNPYTIPIHTIDSSAPSSSPSSYPYSDPALGGTGSHVGIGLPPFLLAVAVVIPLIIVAISTVALCRIIRSKRRQRKARSAMPEMKNLTRPPPDERAYVRPPSFEPPSILVSASQPSESTSLTTNTLPTNQRQSQPVILSTTMDQAYYTGLDTADRISLTDARSQISTDLYDGDEPPPPYRPRSVPPISRDASVRTSHTTRTSSTLRRNNDHSATHLMSSARRGQDRRSPFDDPEHEDDTASLTSDTTIRPQRHAPQQDRLSVVSDLSYQDEPVTGDSAV